MPGIVGIIGGRNMAESGERLQKMVACLKHDPAYVTGTVLEQKLDCAVGWACHPGSFSDCLPVWNERHDICLIFVGEHFSDRSDESVLRLLQDYEQLGARFFETLNGSFSGVVIDLRAGKAVLFNDRYGLNRIYFYETVDGFHFASEAKALLKVLPQLRQLDLPSFAEALTCTCAMQNRTIFAGINLLPHSSAWSFTPGAPVQKEAYFNPAAWEQLPALSPEAYYAKLDETFTRILPRYFCGGQKIALSLTGGLDSRMIMAAAPVKAGQIPCYTFGGMYRECADVRLAKQIALSCGQKHETLSITREFFPQFLDLAQRSVYYTDGAMDVMGSVELFANKAAKQIAPVRMTGNYGSEILRLNVAFKPVPLSGGILEQSFAAQTRTAAATYAAEKTGHSTSFIAFKQVPWLHYARMAVEHSQLTLRSPFLDNDLVPVAYQSPPGHSLNKVLAFRYIAEHNSKLGKIPTDRGMIDLSGKPAGKFKVFCQEFMPRVEYCFDYGMPAWMTKFDRAFAPLHVERLFLGRQKFYHFRTWYRDDLADSVKAVLLDPRTLQRPYLNGKRVEEIVQAHTTGRGNYTLQIHKLLTSEFIQRQLIEAN